MSWPAVPLLAVDRRPIIYIIGSHQAGHALFARLA